MVKMISEVEALQLFENAESPAEIHVALLQSMHLIGKSPKVAAAIRKANDQVQRMKKLQEKQPKPLIPTRQSSHDERIALIERMRRGDHTAEKEMKDTCYDTRCTDCELGDEYQAVCLNFMIYCLGIRVARRLQGDLDNGYEIDPTVTAFMERLSDNPVRVFIHENESFYNLPTWLDQQFKMVVEPTNDSTRKAKKEIREYRLHKDSITKVIASIGRCEEKKPGQ
jgi:hypothetical protein